jgi:pilus assembly protein FimV
MRKAPTLVILGALLAVLSGSAHALGFGRIGGSTTLGQQLNFSALVRLEPDEQLSSECVSAEVFSGENKLPAGAVRVSIEPAAGASERLLRVTTLSLLDEPVVTVTLSAGCTSRLSRKFVVFLDPPVINLAQSAPAEAPAPPAAVETPRGEASAAATPSAVQAARPASPSQAIRPRPPRPKSLAVNPAANAAAAAAAARARKQKADQEVAANRLPPSGPRLKLEAPVVAPGQRASAPSSTTPLAGVANAASAAASAASPAAAQAAASAAVDEQSQLIAKERERLKALEDSLSRLRAETEANQKTLMSLQSRLKGAESERFSNPLVYALGGLCAALVLAVAAMWRRHSLREAAWWAQPQPGPATDAAPRQAPPVVSNAVAQVQAEEFFESESGSLHSAPVVAPVVAPKLSSAPATLPLPTHEPERTSKAPRRELSVEELIDLEQQAEFFVVLGQDEAAIDLLMGHLRSTGGSSPLPYLKLLEIYRRQGDSEAYNRTRERFNRRFNAYAPDWDSDPQQGRSLQAYPEVIERLQAMWSKPTEVIELLDAALFRRDQSEDTFDVPAYRELVLLYSVIRDIAEHDDSGAVVDLLLPIDRSAEVPESPLTAPVPFVSVTELSAADRRIPTLDLDISAVRAFERPVDFETPDLETGSRFVGLVDDPAAPGDKPPRKR